MSFQTTSKNLDYIWKKLIQTAEEKGIDHVHVNQTVGIERKIALTKAEIWAGIQLDEWVLADIGERYPIIGGKTYRAVYGLGNVLIPAKLYRERLIMGFNIDRMD